MFDLLKKSAKFFSGYVFNSTNRLRTASTIIANLLITAANIGAPIAFADYMDKHEKDDQNLQDDFFSWDLLPYALLCVSIILGRVLPKFRNFISDPIAPNVQKQMSLDMLKKCFELELTQHLQTRIGEYSQHLAVNYTTIEKLIPSFFGEIVPFTFDTIAITIAFGVEYGSERNFIFAVPSVVVLLYTLISIYPLKKLAELRKEMAMVGLQTYGSLMQSIGSYQIAHQFGNVSHEIKKVTPIVDKAEELRRRARNIDNTTAIGQHFVNYGGLVGSAIYAAYLNENNIITKFDFAIIVYLMFYFNSRLEALWPALNEFHSAHLDAQKIIDFRNRPSQVADKADAYKLILNDTAPTIKFENVSLSYSPDTKILDNISFEVLSGQTVAIVGKSGAGKTSLMQLLMRFYKCSSGKITINRDDINDVAAESLRSHIAIVSQNPNLFNGNVRENIKYGWLEAQDGDITQAANLAEFALDLSTPVGEGGNKLSGGEKQRVAIARAVLKGGLILILDEPTSSLDPDTALKVQENLNKIKQGATTLIVTHKFYTLTNVDKIFYLENGKFVEEGTFEELIAKKDGKFRAQLEIQCKELQKDINEFSTGKQKQKEKQQVEVILSQNHSGFFNITTNWHRRNEFIRVQDNAPSSNPKDPLLLRSSYSFSATTKN